MRAARVRTAARPLLTQCGHADLELGHMGSSGVSPSCRRARVLVSVFCWRYSLRQPAFAFLPQQCRTACTCSRLDYATDYKSSLVSSVLT